MHPHVLRDALLAELRETARNRARARDVATTYTACDNDIDRLLDQYNAEPQEART